MRKSEMSEFSLETDDRTEEEKLQQRARVKGGGLACFSCMGKEEPPMDTDYQEDMEAKKPQVRINLEILKQTGGKLSETRTRFTIQQLFEAAASDDVTRLDGLETYLHNTGKKLSDSLYQSHGKTVLMKALLHLKDGKNQTVEFFVNISKNIGDIRKFVDMKHTTDYYEGQTALHIAIERRSLPYVKLLVSNGADVHTKACGKFFQPHDGPHFYFGELPLSLAACTNQPDVVDFLMENEFLQADPEQKDSHGNTVLHALVVIAHNSEDNTEDNTEFISSMYDRILKTTARLHFKKKLENIENNNGMTPLKMAAKTGKIGLFSHILKREFHQSHTKHLSRKFTEWVYGPVQCSLYDLASLDSYESNSVLDILVYDSNIPKRHEMLQTEPLNRLLEEKWEKFAGKMFFCNFLGYCLFLAIFTLVATFKKEKESLFKEEENLWLDCCFLTGLILTLCASCYFFVRGILDMKRKRPKLMSLLIDGYYEILFFFQGLLFMICIGLYVTEIPEYICFLVVCLALAWVNLLYFARGYQHMGIYSVMIQKMILSDLLRFLFVYIVFLFGFAAAVVTLLTPPVHSISAPANKTNGTMNGRTLFHATSPQDNCVKPTYKNLAFTLLELFKFTIGMGDMEFSEGFDNKEVFYVLLIGYIILTYILLLNMLIALMNRTVETITRESTSIWKLQRAVTILDMEKRLPCCLRKGFRSGVDKKFVTALGDEQRRCFRVEEVNWNKWNINISNMEEEPGQNEPPFYTSESQRAAGSQQHRGLSLRGGGRWRSVLKGRSSSRRQGALSTETAATNL